ncbi:EpsG family protein [Paenibacillus aurantiacus]|uniref:EpsG family protein n=1 Tax=Paenibacillus aurantiacus TaxID=1936118 RepID=A0ABV5KJJ4_9BACL
MTILWYTLALVFMLALLARYYAVPAAASPIAIRPSHGLAVLAMLALALVSGLRSNIGDTVYYMHSYATGDHRFASIGFEGDFGFNYLQALLKTISPDPQLLVFTTAVITNALVVRVLYTYSRQFELSVFCYLATGMYTVSMNGIRQFLAASIVFLATKYLLAGDWKKYMLVVLLAATMHNTALILIPIYFIVRREAWTRMTFALLAMGVVLAFGFQTVSGFLFSAIEDTHYGAYKDFAEGGASIFRVIVNCVPLALVYLGRERMRELWPKSDYIVNLAMLGAVFMIISTQNWIFARFNIYFGLYNLILISWLVKLFAERDRKLVYCGLLLCYAAYFYYEQVVALQLDYKSNYINW